MTSNVKPPTDPKLAAQAAALGDDIGRLHKPVDLDEIRAEFGNLPDDVLRDLERQAMDWNAAKASMKAFGFQVVVSEAVPRDEVWLTSCPRGEPQIDAKITGTRRHGNGRLAREGREREGR